MHLSGEFPGGAGVEDLALLLPWRQFDPRPGNFSMPKRREKRKKIFNLKNKVKCSYLYERSNCYWTLGDLVKFSWQLNGTKGRRCTQVMWERQQGGEMYR